MSGLTLNTSEQLLFYSTTKLNNARMSLALYNIPNNSTIYIQDPQYVYVTVPANSTTGVNASLERYPKRIDTILQLKAMISPGDTFAIIIRNKPANLARPADTAIVGSVLDDGDVIDISGYLRGG
jgi:hypothetical protein